MVYADLAAPITLAAQCGYVLIRRQIRRRLLLDDAHFSLKLPKTLCDTFHMNMLEQ